MPLEYSVQVLPLSSEINALSVEVKTKILPSSFVIIDAEISAPIGPFKDFHD